MGVRRAESDDCFVPTKKGKPTTNASKIKEQNICNQFGNHESIDYRHRFLVNCKCFPILAGLLRGFDGYKAVCANVNKCMALGSPVSELRCDASRVSCPHFLSPKTHEDISNYNFMQIKADENRLVHTLAELSDKSHTLY